ALPCRSRRGHVLLLQPRLPGSLRAGAGALPGEQFACGEPTSVRSAGVVLAAGSSTRMGSPKQLLPIDGRPLLELVVARACASSLDEVLVVLGANADAILGRIDLGRAAVVRNPDHASGMASSLRAGL